MKNNFERCLKEVVKHEGGFVNHPNDKGGATNLGITQVVWEEWCGRKVSVEDMKKLTVEDVKPLYHNRYWDATKCDDLPSGVDYCVFDTAINSGRVRAAKFLQSVVGVVPDGVIGSITIASTDIRGARLTIEQYCDKREQFLRGLSNFNVFGKGWVRRVAEVRAKALEMVNGR